MKRDKKRVFIEKIKQNFEAEKNTKSYARVQRMAKTISENLYSEDSHFIYELIQNAQDNSYGTENKKLEFFVYDNGILTKNNEKGFDESNIESICDFNDSTKSKKKALGYIGEKGIGFKSVFAITDQPAIHSNGYRFFFKKDEYIEPYWIDDIKNYPEEFKDTKSTNIYLPYSNKFDNKQDLEKKIKDIEPILLLFLDNLDEINIYNQTEKVLSVKKEITEISGQNIVTLHSTTEEYKFVTYSKEILCRDNIKEEKREGVKQRKLIIAFPLNEIEDTRLFAFLPTEIRTGLPFLIQADFLLTASRGDILKSKKWNKWLFDEIVDFFVDIFKNLQKIDKYKYLKYIENQKSNYSFLDKYYQKILDRLQSKNILLSTSNDFVNSSQICILDDHDFMYEYFKDIVYLNENDERYFYVHKDFYLPEYLIKIWEIETINKNIFLRIIGDLSEYFSKQFEEDNSLFEKLLEYIGEDYKTKKYLLNLPIIPVDEGNSVVFKTKKELFDLELFYKLDDDGVLNNVFKDFKIISHKYQDMLQNIPFYTNIFDIKQPNIGTILESLGANDEFFRSKENNINLLIYIKNNYLLDNQEQIIELLAKNYQFLSKNDYLYEHQYKEPNSWDKDSTALFSTKLYISKEYLVSKNCIEKIVNKYCTEKGKSNIEFISNQYLEYDKKQSDKPLKDLQSEWREFFIALNINDDIKFKEQILKMWANDSQGSFRHISERLFNIPFMTSETIFVGISDKSKNYLPYIDIYKFSKNDSIFLFKKLLALLLLEIKYGTTQYRRVKNFYRDFQYDYVYVPWIDMVRNDYPIFVDKVKYKVKDFYLNVDEELQEFFRSLPKEYLIKEHSNIDVIFNLKEKPDFNSIKKLILDKRLKKFEDIKSILLYIHSHYPNEKILFNEIPVFKNSKIKYIPLKKLIWQNGKELGLVDLETSYGSDFKKFFIEQVGIQETPTTEQYIQYLKQNPKNYVQILHKFILHIDKLIEIGEIFPIEHEKIFLTNKSLFAINELIFNDEGIKTTIIPNLFNINQKIVPTFEKIVNHYGVKRISNYSREIQPSNIENDNEINDIYIKLLNYTWDYVFSKNQKKFEELKNDRKFVFETKKIVNGAVADIILKIDVDGQYINVEQDIAILDDTIYLSKSMDKRKIGTKISKYIAKKVGMDFEKIERFYDKVYRMEDYTRDEYYKEESIEKPKEEEDKFDNVFEKLSNIFEGIDDNSKEPEEKNKECEENNESNSLNDEKNSTDVASQDNSKTSLPLKAENQNLKIECQECGELIDRNKYKLHLYKEHHYYDIDPDDDSIFDKAKNKSNAKKKPANEKTRCPECDIELNSKNLKKHLCKIHYQNCGDVNSRDSNTSTDLAGAIDAHKKDIKKKDEQIDPSIIKDEEDKFRQELQSWYDENLKKSKSTTKKNYALRKVKIGKHETKEFLRKQYKGYCQICGFTFDQKNHQGKYFEAFDWSSEKITGQKTNIMDAGSSLCLCSRCHAGIKYGDFEAKFLNKLKSIDISKYTFDEFISNTNTVVEENKIPYCYDFIEMDMYKIQIRLLNEEKYIFYTEEHFLHFYNLLTRKDKNVEG